MNKNYNEQVYSKYGVDFRLFKDGEDDRAFKESARQLAEKKQKTEKEKLERKQEQIQQQQIAFSLTNPAFIVPDEGLALGEGCELQVCYEASAPTPMIPGITFTLTSACSGRKQVFGPYNGITSNGVSKVTVPLPQPDAWAEGMKATFTFKAKLPDKTFIESDGYEMPSKGDRQLFKFQMVTDACACAGKNISIKGRSGNEVCKAFVPSYAAKNVDSVSVKDNKVIEFYYPKPQNGVPLEISLQSGYDAPFPLRLPHMFFRDNQPIYILNTMIDAKGMNDFDSNGSFATLPAQPDSGEPSEEPFIIMELKGSAARAGFLEGVNHLDATSDAGIKVLNETIHGNTIVPGIASIVEQRKLIADFCLKGQFYVKVIGGRNYVVFKGYAGLRRWYKGAKYLLDNAKVVSLSAATQGYGNAVKSAVKGTKGTYVSFVFIGALDMYEWMQQPEGERFFSDLMVQMASDGAQMLLSGVMGAVASTFIAALVVTLGATTIPVWVVVGGGIVVSMMIGGVLTLLDNHFHITEQVKGSTRNVNAALYETYKNNVVEPFRHFLYELEQNILAMVAGNRCLIGY